MDQQVQLRLAKSHRYRDEALALLRRLTQHHADNEALKLGVESLGYLLRSGLPNLSPLLPVLFSLKGEPYTLHDHFPFEPMFNSYMSRKLTYKTGRQVAKSTSLASQGITISASNPFFNTLFVTPLYESIRRFSSNYVRGFIDQSPVKSLLVDPTSSSNVLQRGFRTQSNMFFSFAFLDADRTRGLNCDKTAYDEVQDLDSTFIPIIRETMSGSRWAVEQFTGTPKTLDNTLEQLWTDSSQGEWVIRCRSCRYDNVPALSHDLDDMIGPWRDDISEEKPGVICAKCSLPIYPRDGRWWHKYPERLAEFAGYHVPQIILPLHYRDPDKWGILLGKRQGSGNTPIHVFYNEVCGESYDTGSKLLTKTELEAAAVLHENKLELAVPYVQQQRYDDIILGVDWGGGGEKEISFTTYAVCAFRPDGGIDVVYGFRSLTPHDHTREARIAVDLVHKFRCKFIAHDFNGAGEYREKYIVDAGFPLHRLLPIAYVRAATQRMMRYIEPTDILPRGHYRLDKPRSLVTTCHEIKQRRLRLFAYDHKGNDDPGLLHDFLALVEDKADSRTGRELYTIIRQQNARDDFAHAVNYASCALWYMKKAWPRATAADRFQVPADVLAAASPRAHEQDYADD